MNLLILIVVAIVQLYFIRAMMDGILYERWFKAVGFLLLQVVIWISAVDLIGLEPIGYSRSQDLTILIAAVLSVVVCCAAMYEDDASMNASGVSQVFTVIMFLFYLFGCLLYVGRWSGAFLEDMSELNSKISYSLRYKYGTCIILQT